MKKPDQVDMIYSWGETWIEKAHELLQVCHT